MNSNNKQNMKNTMKIKSLLSFFVPAAMMSLMVASCSDYDNGYDSAAIKFNEDFRKAFGDIDPGQDWNLAERGTVTVSTTKESEVKIYALLGGEYCIVGDYEGVNGRQVLGFDMVEGTKSIMVTDGETAVETVPGGVVTFSGTRTTYGGNGTVVINKITDPNGFKLDENGVTYPMYKEATEADYEAMKKVIPEIGYRKTYTNLNKVTHDFTYKSNGTFIVYPYYWETSSNNTIGIYYYDNNNVRQEVDLYTIKAGDEFQYATGRQYSEKSAVVSNDVTNYDNATLYWNYYNWYYGLTWKETSYNVIRNVDFGFTAADIQNADKLVIDDIEFMGNTGGFRILFVNNDNSNESQVVYVNKKDNVAQLKDNGKYRYEFNLSNLETRFRNNSHVCLAGAVDGDDEAHRVNPYSTFDDYGKKPVYGELRFSSIKLVTDAGTGWHNYSSNFCSEIFTNNLGTRVRGQGIKVNIPAGTVFGMYLRKTDSNNVTFTFYSQDELNNPAVVGNGVIDNGNGYVAEQEGMHPCYASTFHVGDQMFLGFEDWPNHDMNNKSDFDLNDVVLAFDGCKPTIINEDPTPGGTWLIASEDLGSSFDVDYNDIVFKVEHLSGKEYATVTPLAAGGTLASYIFFLDPLNGNNETCLGEVHQMFNMAPQVSGEYSPINAGADRAEYRGVPVTIKVDKNWTMAYYSTDTWQDQDDKNYGEAVNMGGFEIRTLKKGTEAPTGEVTIGNSAFTGASRIQAPNELGVAPYILCLPYYYTRMHMDGYNPAPNKKTKYVWAWPSEYVTICNAGGVGPYPKFKEWVSDKSKNTWYMEKDNRYSTVSDLYWVSDMTQDEINTNPYNAGGNENGGNNNGDDDNGVYQIKTDETCRFTFQNNGVTYALAYDENQSQSANGGLVMKVLDNNDPNQIWCLKVSNNQNYGYLYNYGSEKSIDVDKNSTPWKAGWTEGTPGDMSGRFKLMSSGSGYYLYLRNYEKSDADHQTGPQYIGSDNINDGASVWMNKTVAAGNAILWTKSAASAPVINGGDDNKGTLITQLSGATIGQTFGSDAYKVSKDVFAGATSVVITFEGNDYEYFINDTREWSNYVEHVKKSANSTYDVGSHLQDVIDNGLVVGMQTGFGTTQVYVKITK